MGNFSYLKAADNPVESATLAATTEATNFPVANLTALPISKLWKSTSASVTGQKITIDLGLAQAVDLLALVNHNLQSSATITLKGGSSPDPDGSQFQTTVSARARVAWKILGAVETWRYWSVTLDDAGNPDNQLRAGYLMLGSKTTLTFQFDPEWIKEPLKIVRSLPSEVGVPMVGNKIADGHRLELAFGGLAESERNTLDTFLDGLDLMRRPFLLVPDPDEAAAYFVRLLETYTIEQRGHKENALIPGLIFQTDHTGFDIV